MNVISSEELQPLQLGNVCEVDSPYSAPSNVGQAFENKCSRPAINTCKSQVKNLFNNRWGGVQKIAVQKKAGAPSTKKGKLKSSKEVKIMSSSSIRRMQGLCGEAVHELFELN